MMRKLGDYGAAIAVAPYLLIKLAWTFGILLPNARMAEPSWRGHQRPSSISTEDEPGDRSCLNP